MANPNRTIGSLMTVLFVVGMASQPTLSQAESSPGGDAPPAHSPMIESATPTSDSPPPVDCVAEDSRPICQVRSRNVQPGGTKKLDGAFRGNHVVGGAMMSGPTIGTMIGDAIGNPANKEEDAAQKRPTGSGGIKHRPTP